MRAGQVGAAASEIAPAPGGHLLTFIVIEDGKKRDVEILSTPSRNGIMYYPSSRGLPVVFKYADLMEVIPVEDAELGSDQEMKDFFNGLDVEAQVSVTAM